MLIQSCKLKKAKSSKVKFGIDTISSPVAEFWQNDTRIRGKNQYDILTIFGEGSIMMCYAKFV